MRQTRRLAGRAQSGKPAAKIVKPKPARPRTASKEELAQRYLGWLIYERRILAQEIEAVCPADRRRGKWNECLQERIAIVDGSQPFPQAHRPHYPQLQPRPHHPAGLFHGVDQVGVLRTT
jgi:hypothetical protein